MIGSNQRTAQSRNFQSRGHHGHVTTRNVKKQNGHAVYANQKEDYTSINKQSNPTHLDQSNMINMSSLSMISYQNYHYMSTRNKSIRNEVKGHYLQLFREKHINQSNDLVVAMKPKKFNFENLKLANSKALSSQINSPQPKSPSLSGYTQNLIQFKYQQNIAKAQEKQQKIDEESRELLQNQHIRNLMELKKLNLEIDQIREQV